MKVCLFSLGCKVNQYECDAIAAALAAKGYDVTDELSYADVYILNTCAVTQEAERKSRQLMTRVGKLNPNAKIYVMGCASQHSQKEFSERGATYVSGVEMRSKLIEFEDLSNAQVHELTNEYEELFRGFSDTYASRRIREYVKIQDGCDRFCSYCLIPYLRGRSRSRNVESVMNEINASKAPEIVLTGIDLSSYDGADGGLAGLIVRLRDTKKRIRLGSLEVSVIDDKLLSACKNTENFCPHFHLSLQCGSDNVLKAMNRHYTSAEYMNAVKRIRSIFEDAAITTDVIVGYPTETDGDFEDSLDFVKSVGFSDIHVFPFSARSGTRAYKLKRVSGDVMKSRVERMSKVKTDAINEYLIKQIGKTRSVLIESVDENLAVGYSKNYVRVYVTGANVGDVLNVRIKNKFKDGLIAEKE